MTLNSIDVGQQLFFGCSHNPSHSAHGTQCGLAASDASVHCANGVPLP